jgi:hypothetical protein
LSEDTKSSILAFHVALFLSWNGKIKKLVYVIALAYYAVVFLGVESILKDAAGVEVIFLARVGPELIDQCVKDLDLLSLDQFRDILIEAGGLLLDVQEFSDEL